MNATPEQKSKLRKLKTVPGGVKAAVYSGICEGAGPGPAIQFHKDVMLYNVWEALLYVEGYEDDGYYVKGTAQKALDTIK